jgi:hypothetical protein
MDKLLDTINHLIKDNGYTPEQLITIEYIQRLKMVHKVNLLASIIVLK